MVILKTIKEVKKALKELCTNSQSIGFVPTMGALHEGHASLVSRSVDENAVTAVSIFVNPIQFNNENDLKNYPVTIENDIELLEGLNCDIVFIPDKKEIYPVPVNEKYDFGQLERVMEGKFRPGHFNGVAVVVKRLFEIVEPNKAYFGEKDFQQLAIIKRLVKIIGSDIQIVPCPTLREDDGLAMSSRNRRLTEEQRANAAIISVVLKDLKELLKVMPVKEAINKSITRVNETEHMKVEYLEIVDDESLKPVNSTKNGKGIIACMAAFCGEVRLIDNYRIS